MERTEKEIKWIETFFLITGNAATLMMRNDFRSTNNKRQTNLEDVHEIGGTYGVCEFCTGLADEFEELHKYNQWIDEDYYEAIDKFTKEKFA